MALSQYHAQQDIVNKLESERNWSPLGDHRDALNNAILTLEREIPSWQQLRALGEIEESCQALKVAFGHGLTVAYHDLESTSFDADSGVLTVYTVQHVHRIDREYNVRFAISEMGVVTLVSRTPVGGGELQTLVETRREIDAGYQEDRHSGLTPLGAHLARTHPLAGQAQF